MADYFKLRLFSSGFLLSIMTLAAGVWLSGAFFPGFLMAGHIYIDWDASGFDVCGNGDPLNQGRCTPIPSTTEGNSLTTDTGSFRNLYGGYSLTDSRFNAVHTGTGTYQNIYGGFSNHIANNNLINTGTGAYQNIYGGYSDYMANNNRVETGTGTYQNVFGGYSNGFDKQNGAVADGNVVNIGTGGYDKVYGGFSSGQMFGDSSASGNTVEISTGDYRHIYGGYSEHVSFLGTTASADRNRVVVKFAWMNTSMEGYMDYGTLRGSVYGGYSASDGRFDQAGTANGNQVAIGSDAAGYDWPLPLAGPVYYPTVEGSVYGGYIDRPATSPLNFGGKNAEAKQNGVLIYRSIVNDNVYGGYIASLNTPLHSSASASGNTVEITRSKVNGEVRGGRAAFADYFTNKGLANQNTVNINRSYIAGDVHAGSTSDSQTGTADENKVNIIDSTIMGGISGGSHLVSALTSEVAGQTNKNEVSIDSGVIEGDVHGGWVVTSGNGTAISSHNKVLISHSRFNGDISGGSAVNGTAGQADNNSVTISDSIGLGSVFGGRQSSGASSGEVVFSASNNAVSISNSTLGSNLAPAYVYGGLSSAKAVNNKVSLAGATSISGPVLGGPVFQSGGSSAPDFFTGNVLNVINPPAGGISVGDDKRPVTGQSSLGTSIANFSAFNFTFSSGGSVDAIGLLASGHVYLNDMLGGNSGQGSRVANISISGNGSPLALGQTLTLIKTANCFGNGDNVCIEATNFTQTSASGSQGKLLTYEYDLEIIDGNLVATVSEVKLRRSSITKPLSEGFLSGIVSVNQGTDLVMDKGISQAVAASAGSAGLQGFGAFSGGSIRYNTGSHVDVDSFSVLTGLALGREMSSGHLTLGLFFEYGRGDYNTYNSIPNAASVNGSGDTDYLGGGLLGRFDFTGGRNGHFYTETSIRYGSVKNDFSSSDIVDSNGYKASYDTSSRYYGFTLGGGYVWQISENSGLDFYGKYLWTRQKGDKATFHADDPVKFEAVKSERLRAGLRYTRQCNDWLRPYAGAAYEHEFDGDARASAWGMSIQPPSLKGDTGIGELGLIIKPASDSRFSFDVGLQGYVGKREGLSGSLQVGIEF